MEPDVSEPMAKGTNPAPTAMPEPDEEPVLVVQSARRKPRKLVRQAARAAAWFDYPFEERLVAEPVPPEVDEPVSEFSEYSFEPAEAPHDGAMPLAYVVAERPRRNLPRR